MGPFKNYIVVRIYFSDHVPLTYSFKYSIMYISSIYFYFNVIMNAKIMYSTQPNAMFHMYPDVSLLFFFILLPISCILKNKGEFCDFHHPSPCRSSLIFIFLWEEEEKNKSMEEHVASPKMYNNKQWSCGYIHFKCGLIHGFYNILSKAIKNAQSIRLSVRVK